MNEKNEQLLADVIGRYPQLREIKPEHSAAILMFSAGISADVIADTLDIARSTVYELVKKYRVSEDIRISVELQRMILASQLGAIAVEIAGRLNLKRDELKGMNLNALLNTLKNVMQILGDIKISPPKDENSADDISKKIAAHLEENVSVPRLT